MDRLKLYKSELMSMDALLGVVAVARILPDAEIKKLIGTILIGADEKMIDPNGIKLRLGSHIHFHSTGEDNEISPGQYVRIQPGESAMICSMEKSTFVQKPFD